MHQQFIRKKHYHRPVSQLKRTKNKSLQEICVFLGTATSYYQQGEMLLYLIIPCGYGFPH